MLLQMYPLIQEHVWAKVATEEDLLRTVLDTFIRVSVTMAVESVCERGSNSTVQYGSKLKLATCIPLELFRSLEPSEF